MQLYSPLLPPAGCLLIILLCACFCVFACRVTQKDHYETVDTRTLYSFLLPPTRCLLIIFVCVFLCLSVSRVTQKDHYETKGKQEPFCWVHKKFIWYVFVPPFQQLHHRVNWYVGIPPAICGLRGCVTV